MDLNYMLTDLFLAERIEDGRRLAGELQCGARSPLVAIIGRAAAALGRAADGVAHWADGNSELQPGARRATIR